MGSNNRSSRPKGRRLGCPHLPTRLWTAVLLLAGCVLPVVYILLLTPVPDGSQVNRPRTLSLPSVPTVTWQNPVPTASASQRGV
jgi:hypothetical protein